MVGALSACMPMTSSEFWALVFQEWGLVVAADALGNTDLRGQLDGADLERNARRAEQLMVDAGLALALSDRTTLVGERARRQE
jgi:predicted ABC-type transport system involved in lysophospholipase L1 biosynthesis ATPase subunit